MLADVQNAYYAAVQNLARLSYQAIIAATFVVFPLVSHAAAKGDEAATRSYVRNAMRFSLLVLLGVAAPIAGAASGVLRIVYPAEYAAGADALAILALGMVAFALFVIAATVISGSGKPARRAA